MKKSIFFSGFVATIGLMLGLMFRFFHWSDATNILFWSDLALMLCCLQLIIDGLQNRSHRARLHNVQNISGSLGGLFFSIGGIFKCMHWPGANVTILFAMALLMIVFVPALFKRMYNAALQSE